MAIKDYFKKKNQQNIEEVVDNRTEEKQKLENFYDKSSYHYFNMKRISGYKENENELEPSKSYVILGSEHRKSSYLDGIYQVLVLDTEAMQSTNNFTKHLHEEFIDVGKLVGLDKNSIRDLKSDQILGCVIEFENNNLVLKKDETEFDRAKRLSKIIEKFSNVNSGPTTLEILKTVYDNTYFLVTKIIATQCKGTALEFKSGVREEIGQDVMNNVPLKEFISKWENWSESSKPIIELEKEKGMQERKQKEEMEKYLEEQNEKKQCEKLCDYMKL